MAPKRKPKQRQRPHRREDPKAPSKLIQESRWLWLSGLLLVTLVAAAVFGNSVDGDFVWDDRMLILKDPEVQSLSSIGRFFTEDFFVRQENELGYGYYRPIVKASYAIDHAVWGRNPSGYHLTNILLHAACTLLVMLLLRRLGMTAGAALVAGLVFAVHPIHTENVAWIAGRTDLLAFLFSGLSLLFYLEATESRPENAADRQPGTTVRRSVFPLLSLACFALAMLAKEMSVVLVPWIACIELFVRRRGLARSLLSAVPYAAIVGAYLVVRLVWIRVPVPGQPDGHSIGAAVIGTGQVMVRYLGWMTGFSELNAYVQNPYVTGVFDVRFLGSAAILAALAYAVWRWGRKDSLLLALAAMLATSFGPVLNLVRTAGPPDMGNLMAERFCYFPSFPFVALVVLVGSRVTVSGSRQARVFGWAALATWLAFGVHATVTRNLDWRDDLTFLETTLRQSPEAALLWTNLANHHLEGGELRQAQIALSRATALAPASLAVLSARATMLVVGGRPADAVPIQEKIAAIASRSRPVVLCNLAYLYRLTGREEEALTILEKLLADGRRYSAMYFNLGEIYRDRGEIQQARIHYRKAIDGDPLNLQMRVALAALEASAGRLDTAEAIYREALRSHPSDARIYNNIATLLVRQGDFAEAIILLERAIQIEPTTTNRINYARLLLSSDRATEALAVLEIAVAEAPDAGQRELAERELSRTLAWLNRTVQPPKTAD